jgi:hypothetical protein
MFQERQHNDKLGVGGHRTNNSVPAIDPAIIYPKPFDYSRIQEGKQPSHERIPIRELTLPHDENSVAQLYQLLHFPQIARPVIAKLLLPEFLIISGNLPELTTFVGMPVTAMHENGPPAFAVHQIGPPGQPFAVHPEAKAEGMNEPADRGLRSSIYLLDSGHEARPVNGGEERRVLLLRHEHCSPAMPSAVAQVSGSSLGCHGCFQ